jgi:hypothetical protein
MDATLILLIAILVLVFFSLFVRGGSGESPRLRLVERKLDLLLKNMGVDPNAGLDDQLQQLVREGRKIEAIKVYRAQSGVGLKEAKDYIEGRYGI